jgi:hypothetical protein
MTETTVLVIEIDTPDGYFGFTQPYLLQALESYLEKLRHAPARPSQTEEFSFPDDIKIRVSSWQRL